jgi:hypothetical protein
MSGVRVLRSKTNKTNDSLTQCANCAKEFGKESICFEEKVELSVNEVLEKIFNLTLDPLLNRNIQLCQNCGLQLYNLYKCYEEFLESCTIHSILSKFLIDKNNLDIPNLKLKNRTSKRQKKNLKTPKSAKSSKKLKSSSTLKKVPGVEDVQENKTQVGADSFDDMPMFW